MKEKILIYQVLPRLWRNGRFSGWDAEAFDYLKSLSVTHVWYTGIPRHASGKPFVKGDPGSPYAVEDWHDVNPYLADVPSRRMSEFKALVDRTHKAGLKVITDFIPNHVARSYKGDIPHFDDCDYDWTDTLKVDYSAEGCWDRMLEVILFWAGKGVDGMRCDMVELIPPEFFKWATAEVRKRYHDFLFIGEVYRRDNYRRYVTELGFDLIYDKTGLYDTLRAIMAMPASTRGITWNWQDLQDLQPGMLNFLENHDEQRICSQAFLGGYERSVPGMAVAALFNGASLLIYSGQEQGEDAADSDDGRTSIFNWTGTIEIKGLDTHRNRVLGVYRKLLKEASDPVFKAGANWDLAYCNEEAEGYDPDRHFVFMRYLGNDRRVVFCNFTDSEARVSVNIPEIDGKPACTVEMKTPGWNYSIKKLK